MTCITSFGVHTGLSSQLAVDRVSYRSVRLGAGMLVDQGGGWGVVPHALHQVAEAGAGS